MCASVGRSDLLNPKHIARAREGRSTLSKPLDISIFNFSPLHNSLNFKNHSPLPSCCGYPRPGMSLGFTLLVSNRGPLQSFSIPVFSVPSLVS